MDGFIAKKSCGVFGGPELVAAGPLSLAIESAFCFKGSLRVSKSLCNSASPLLVSEFDIWLSFCATLFA